MKKEYDDNEIKVTTIKKDEKVVISKKLLIILICVFTAFTIIVAAIAGSIGSKSGGKTSAEILSIYTTKTTDSPLPASNESIVSVVEAVADTVVEINCEIVAYDMFNRPYRATSAGSGVIISEGGLIITNQHVVANSTNITVIQRDGTSLSATYIGGSANDDIALIKVQATNLHHAVFGISENLKVGEPVVAIGNPLGTLGGSVTNGIISALDRQIELDGVAMNLLQTNAAINPGNSGGGLFNLRGELIAIVSAKSTGTDIEGLGFAIPADHAKLIAINLLEAVSDAA